MLKSWLQHLRILRVHSGSHSGRGISVISCTIAPHLTKLAPFNPSRIIPTRTSWSRDILACCSPGSNTSGCTQALTQAASMSTQLTQLCLMESAHCNQTHSTWTPHPQHTLFCCNPITQATTSHQNSLYLPPPGLSQCRPLFPVPTAD